MKYRRVITVPPVTRYVPSCYSPGGPEAHAANPTTQNPTTQLDAARPSQLHSALQCHRMAFEFGSLLICMQCSADNGLTCYGGWSPCGVCDCEGMAKLCDTMTMM